MENNLSEVTLGSIEFYGKENKVEPNRTRIMDVILIRVIGSDLIPDKRATPFWSICVVQNVVLFLSTNK